MDLKNAVLDIWLKLGQSLDRLKLYRKEENVLHLFWSARLLRDAEELTEGSDLKWVETELDILTLDVMDIRTQEDLEKAVKSITLLRDDMKEGVDLIEKKYSPELALVSAQTRRMMRKMQENGFGIDFHPEGTLTGRLSSYRDRFARQGLLNSPIQGVSPGDHYMLWDQLRPRGQTINEFSKRYANASKPCGEVPADGPGRISMVGLVQGHEFHPSSTANSCLYQRLIGNGEIEHCGQPLEMHASWAKKENERRQEEWNNRQRGEVGKEVVFRVVKKKGVPEELHILDEVQRQLDPILSSERRSIAVSIGGQAVQITFKFQHEFTQHLVDDTKTVMQRIGFTKCEHSAPMTLRFTKE